MNGQFTAGITIMSLVTLCVLTLVLPTLARDLDVPDAAGQIAAGRSHARHHAGHKGAGAAGKEPPGR